MNSVCGRVHMSTFFKVLLVILIILVIALVVLYFVGRKMQRKQAAQQEQMEAAKQSVSMLVIDKKIMPLKQSGLPQIVIDQTPKLMRRSKLPIVKAKVGPRIMTLVADSAIFDAIPVKKEEITNASSLWRNRLIPMASAATSSSRIALNARPKEELISRTISAIQTAAIRIG